jgi:hypothetical protein
MLTIFKRSAVLIFIFLLIVSFSFAAEFYVDPANGDINNDGSISSPWSTLQEVFENDLIETNACSPLPCPDTQTYIQKNSGAPVKAGDTLILLDGFHGELTTSIANQFYNDD